MERSDVILDFRLIFVGVDATLKIDVFRSQLRSPYGQSSNVLMFCPSFWLHIRCGEGKGWALKVFPEGLMVDMSSKNISSCTVSYKWRHRCAGGLKKKLYLRSGSQRHRHFAGFFNVPVLQRHGTTLFMRWFRHTAPFSRLLQHAWDT